MYIDIQEKEERGGIRFSDRLRMLKTWNEFPKGQFKQKHTNTFFLTVKL